MLSILIVEDDITFSLMLTTWLGKKGFVVRSSSSVSDAKRRLGEEAFDLVISDLRLPDSDGIDLLKWLKSTHPSLPLIMMTSLCGDTNGGSGDEAGSGGLYCQAAEPG